MEQWKKVAQFDESQFILQCMDGNVNMLTSGMRGTRMDYGKKKTPVKLLELVGEYNRKKLQKRVIATSYKQESPIYSMS